MRATSLAASLKTSARTTSAWRLQRTCEDEGDCQDIVVNLKASGTFTATSQGDDEAMKVFAEKLRGRWYCDGEDQELRLARFERQSPVEWYTGMPSEPDAPLSNYAGHVTLGAHLVEVSHHHAQAHREVAARLEGDGSLAEWSVCPTDYPCAADALLVLV